LKGNQVAAQADAIITAGLRPDLFAGAGVLARSRTLVWTCLIVLMTVGFAYRVSGLSAEGLSEDELNKLNAVADYRANGLTGANGEHPMLMKSLQTLSVLLAEKWNSSAVGANQQSQLYVQPETALRLPVTIFGAATTILIYLVAVELFGAEVALIAAALWAFDPNAIGFNRIAKEDSFLLFFFLLANVFWLRGQRIAESQSNRNPSPYYWATAASYGAMVASKYLPHLIAISISYYWMFQNLPETRWRLGKRRLFLFFVIMGATFMVLSPTILLPDTWRQMGLFAGEKRIGHDGYEFMGQLYTHRLTDWLAGIPWYFYLVFTWVKVPLLTLVGLIAGLPLLFRRKLGDGRYFVLFWLFYFFASLSFFGGKFTRYYTIVLPALLITAALGLQLLGRWLARSASKLLKTTVAEPYIRTAIALLVVGSSLAAATQAAPYFRLHLNAFGGGPNYIGYYFPHDEFYDTSMRDAVTEIAQAATPGLKIASESASLVTHYTARTGRADLVAVSLSDPVALKQLRVGDYIIAARGRRYFSNDAVLQALKHSITPTLSFAVGDVPSIEVYQVDEKVLSILFASLNGQEERRSSN
jgi:hypothetical protein